MEEPGEDGSAISNLAFSLHEIVGFTTLGIVILHWIWSIFDYSEGGLAHLFPWDKEGRQSIFSDIKTIMRFKIPSVTKKGGLAGFVHGLGLLAVTGAGLAGMGYFLLTPVFGEPGVIAEGFKELHEGMAALVWTYWLGHVGAALLHHLQGQKVLNNMFSLKERVKKNQVSRSNDFQKNDEVNQH